MEQIEQRRLFTYEERKKILKRSNGMCACCGKPLTTKTMTVEHMIPLLRGGTNDMENLTALCYDCNQFKGNLLYMPMGFYTALTGTQRLKDMQKHVADWFGTVKDEFDIEKFPLIAPRTNFQGVITDRGYSKTKFIKDLLVQWQFVGNEQRYTIEAVTDLDVREIRRLVNDFVADEEDLPVSLYSLHKVTNDRILAVAAVRYKKNGDLVVYIPWCEISKRMRGEMILGFVDQLFVTINKIAGYAIRRYIVISVNEECLSKFRPEYLPLTLSGDVWLGSGKTATGEKVWTAQVNNNCFDKLKNLTENRVHKPIRHNHKKKKKNKKRA